MPILLPPTTWFTRSRPSIKHDTRPLHSYLPFRFLPVIKSFLILPFVTQPSSTCSSTCQQLLYHLSLFCQILPSATTLIDRKQSHLALAIPGQPVIVPRSISSACIALINIRAPISCNRTSNAPTILYISHRNNANDYTPFLFVIPTLLTIDALVINTHQLIAMTSYQAVWLSSFALASFQLRTSQRTYTDAVG
jgi:hypothetical protein